MLIFSPLAFPSVWNFEGCMCFTYVSRPLVYMLLLYIFIISSFSIPLGFCSCHLIILQIAEATVLKLVLLHKFWLYKHHFCTFPVLLKIIHLSGVSVMWSHKTWDTAWLNSWETCPVNGNKLWLYIFSFTLQFSYVKDLSTVNACWLASYPQQICISFWFYCH